MARLRAPGGCPWDREQTHSTLRTYLIEEAYEVLDALDSHDDAKFAEELGDLLLQVLFHAQIAAEERRFSINDVIREIHDKMVRRHPHVFGDTTAKTAADVLRNWEIIKKQERTAKTQSSATVSGARPSVLEGGSSEVTENVATEDGVSILDGIFAKLAEETAELQSALAADVAAGLQTRQGESAQARRSLGEGPPAAATSPSKPSPSSGAKFAERGIPLQNAASKLSDTAHIEGEIGDLLFVLVNLARFLHVDPELALKKTSAKFTRRFRQMEQFASEQNTTLARIPRDHLESLWDRAKLQELRREQL